MLVADPVATVPRACPGKCASGSACEASVDPLSFANEQRVTVELPDALAAELNAVVRAGWFATQVEAVRGAAEEYFREEKLARLKQQQLSDIAWAVKLAKEGL